MVADDQGGLTSGWIDFLVVPALSRDYGSLLRGYRRCGRRRGGRRNRHRIRLLGHDALLDSFAASAVPLPNRNAVDRQILDQALDIGFASSAKRDALDPVDRIEPWGRADRHTP